MKRQTTRRIAQTLSLLALLAVCRPALGIPAFARKYGLRCSACHEAWPKLNNFGQTFKDNGYQLMNDRDAPIWQNPGYFPMTIRITPQWHREHENRMAVDHVPGDAESGLVEQGVTTSGFDLSGLDLWTAGTLAKNISFQVLPSFDAGGSFGFESAWVRFDNLMGSPWLNFKFGKHELDTPISEKRFLTLTDNGGFFQLYHFTPLSTDINQFGGIGENQLGVEVAGHSSNSYTRYALSFLSSNTGTPGLPTGHSYDVYGDFNQAFEIGRLGLQRFGAYGYRGESPTYYLTNGGQPIPGTGMGARPFYRAGVYGIWYIKKFDVSTLFMHGEDNVLLGTGTAANQISLLPPGAKAPVWNGAFAEAHYTINPQFLLVGRYEAIRMAQQALPTMASNFGNTDAVVLGYRWYPIMTSRGGLAFHQEYARVRMRGVSAVNGLDDTTSSFMMGFDFDF